MLFAVKYNQIYFYLQIKIMTKIIAVVFAH